MDRHSKCTLGAQSPRVQIIRHRWKNNNYPEPKEAAQYFKGYIAFETGFFGGGVKVE